MFRAPHMKTSVNALRLHRLALLLRHSRIRHEGTQQWERHRPSCSSTGLTHPHSRRSVPRGFSVVLHISEWIRVCISVSFLLTRMNCSCIHWIRSPKTLRLCLHASLNSSRSRFTPAVNLSKCLPPKTKAEKSLNCPERHIKRQTCYCVLNRGTSDSGSFQRLANSSAWTSRTAVPSLQTRGLHRSTGERAAADLSLSAVNEARCKHALQANGALYEREGRSWAAVLVCLCAVSGDPALLFTLRSAKLKGRHKGDVSFAGGKKDASDRTVVDTALREAREELGIHVTEDNVWGVMKPLRDATGMMIAPVIANLGPLEALSFQPNPSEVEEIFTLTLEHLCQPRNRGYTHFRTGDRYGYTLPVFHSPKYRVWGLTAVALDQTLKLIVQPKQLLDHRLVQ